MRTIILLAALSLAHAAETCTEVSATASSGQCSGMKMSTKMCLPDGVSADTYSTAMGSVLDAVDKTECEAAMAGLDCASLGGKNNADFCKTGGHFCKMFAGSMNSVACDGTCPAPTSTKKQCCSDMPKMMDMYCTGVGKDIKDLMESAGADSGACSKADCISMIGSASLRTAALFPVAVMSALLSMAFVF